MGVDLIQHCSVLAAVLLTAVLHYQVQQRGLLRRVRGGRQP